MRDVAVAAAVVVDVVVFYILLLLLLLLMFVMLLHRLAGFVTDSPRCSPGFGQLGEFVVVGIHLFVAVVAADVGDGYGDLLLPPRPLLHLLPLRRHQSLRHHRPLHP